jgi:hypothetical protein
MAKKKRLDLILGAKDRATSVLGRVSGAIGGFARRVLSLAGPLAAVFSAAGAVQFGRKAVAAFIEQEQAVANLRTALINAGDAGASSLGAMQDFASGIQAITTKGDEATLALASYIATVGELSGDALQRATTATLGLARATGQGEQIMARAYLNAMQGNFSMLERYIPALRAATTEQEKMALVQGLAANGFKLLESDAQTAGGQIQQMKNTFGDFMELVGARIAPVLADVAGGVKRFAEQNGERIAGFVGTVIGKAQELAAMAVPVVQRVIALGRRFLGWWSDNMLPVILAYAGTIRQVAATIIDAVSTGVQTVIGWIESVVGPIGNVGGTVTKMRDAVQTGLIAVEFGFKNWRDIVELGALKAGLAVVTFAGQVRHFFGEVIPSVLEWLGDEWQNILIDLHNFTQTVMKNILANMKETVTSLPELLSGQKSLGEIWGKSIVEGFESQIETLPDIADRVKGELERSLAGDVSNLEEGLGSGFVAFLERRRREIEDQKSTIKDFFTFDGGDGASGPGKVDPNDLLKPGGVTVPVHIDGEGEAEAQAVAARASRERRNRALGVVEVTQRFMGLGSLGGDDGPAKQTAENTKNLAGLMRTMIDKAQKQVEAIERMSGDSGEGVLTAVRVT